MYITWSLVCTPPGQSEFTCRNCLRALSQSPRREVCICSGALCVYHPAESRFTCSNVYKNCLCIRETKLCTYVYIQAPRSNSVHVVTCESGFRRVIYTERSRTYTYTLSGATVRGPSGSFYMCMPTYAQSAPEHIHTLPAMKNSPDRQTD